MSEEQVVVLKDEGEIEWPVEFTLTVTHKTGQRSEIVVRSTDEIAALAALSEVGSEQYVLQVASALMAGGTYDDDDYDGEDD